MKRYEVKIVYPGTGDILNEIVVGSLRGVYDMARSLVRHGKHNKYQVRIVVRDYDSGGCVFHAYARFSLTEYEWIARIAGRGIFKSMNGMDL